MTSMPASRSARAMIFAPRSWPSRPGLATTTRIFFVLLGAGSVIVARRRAGSYSAAPVGARDATGQLARRPRRSGPPRVRRPGLEDRRLAVGAEDVLQRAHD